MAVASTGPAITVRPSASALNWFSRRFLIPPPKICRGSRRFPNNCFQPFQHEAVFQRQAFQRHPHDFPVCLGNRLPAIRTELCRFSPACCRGAERVCCPGRSPPGRVSLLPQAVVSSSYERPHSRLHSCTSHSPVMFLDNRHVPHTPPSLVKLYARAFSLNDGLLNFRTQDGPCARS